jgi:hypothetical protein
VLLLHALRPSLVAAALGSPALAASA